MAAGVTFAAVDLGASSGRVMVARVGPGTAGPARGAPVPEPAGAHRRHACTGTCSASTPASSTACAPPAATPGGSTASASTAGRSTTGCSTPTARCSATRCTTATPGTTAVVAAVHAVVGPTELYRVSGLQHLPFNTVFQLAAAPRHALSSRRAHAAAGPRPARLLAHRCVGAEVTNASTTGLLDATTGRVVPGS